MAENKSNYTSKCFKGICRQFQDLASYGIKHMDSIYSICGWCDDKGRYIITETDLKPVQQEAIKQGLTISAIHNHFIWSHPNIMYVHIGRSGSAEEMSLKTKAVLDKIAENTTHFLPSLLGSRKR